MLNKTDQLGPARVAALQAEATDSVLVSARTGEGLDALKTLLLERLELTPRGVRLRFHASEARAIAGVYTAGRVVAHEVHGDEVRIQAEIPERLIERYREHLV